jgi:DNA repair exonuclease SbcCD nuclease subunit
MKVIAIGDPHFQTENIPEVNLFIERMETLAKEECPDLIVILGDVLHTHERLHTIPLNKAYEFVDKMRNIAPTIVLVGNHDFCLGRDVEIPLFEDGSKMSQDIQVGDLLIGDDSNPRTVLSVTRGHTKMYDVMYGVSSNNLSAGSRNLKFTVSRNHRLCLRGNHRHIIYNDNGAIVYYIVNEELRWRSFDDLKTANDFYDGLALTPLEFKIGIEDYLALPEELKRNLYLYSWSRRTYRFSITESKETEYFGWEVDGNHKFVIYNEIVTSNSNNQQYLSENHWMNGMKEWANVTIVDKPLFKEFGGAKFVFVPYVYPGRFVEALESNKDVPFTWKDADCIFAHQEFAGCKMGAVISVEGDKWEPDCPKVVSGHIHSRQTPQKNIYYCGSSMQHAFGESEKNVIPVLEFSSSAGKNYELREVDLELPRKKIIYSDVSDIDELKLPENTQDKIKVTLSGSYEEFKSFKKTKKYQDLVKKGTKVVYKPKKIKEIGREPEDPECEVDFTQILISLIEKEQNAHLKQAYELVVNNKEVEVGIGDTEATEEND